MALALFLGATMHAVPSSAQSFVPADEASVHQMVNATRAQHGLRPLDRLDGLVNVARDQSVRMVEDQRLFHNPLLAAAITAVGLDWSWTGENVGVGPDINAIEEAFLNSQHHYENIVRSNYTALGVGVVSDPDGRVYVTQVFAEVRGAVALPPPPPATPTPAPATPPPAPPPTPKPTPVPTPKPEIVVIEGGVIEPGSPFGA